MFIIYGEGAQAKFTPLFKGGGGESERFYSGSGEGGGETFEG